MIYISNECLVNVMCSYVLVPKYNVHVSCDNIADAIRTNKELDLYLEYIVLIHTVYFIWSY